MDYSFEYLGNYAKIVRTPLTDKCFLTLTQVIRYNLFVNVFKNEVIASKFQIKDNVLQWRLYGCFVGKFAFYFGKIPIF